VHIDAVEFVDFRSYQSLLFTPTASLNILTGPNAQGKTNLLEGLAVLAVGRSFRGAKPAEMVRWGVECGHVTGKISRGDSARSVRRVLAPREDGLCTMTGEGCPWSRAVPFTWTDLAIVTGAPQARRNFLDGFVVKVYPSYASTLRRYRQVLSRRNHLLQTGAAGRLDPWNEQLVALGLEIIARRRQAAAALCAEVARLYPVLSGCGDIAIGYRSGMGERPTAAEFHEALRARRGEELRRGQTLVGPHRDDVSIELNGRDLRTFGSRGQQRLTTLILRLAEVRPVEEAVGSTPVLLMDDPLSELDPAVQDRLLEHLACSGQVFITTADAVLPEVDGARWWHIRGGAVEDGERLLLQGAA
jgi:DNA replication and repair protein RecF